MVLHAVTRNVSKTATVSMVFILVGVMLIVAQRRSYSLILYVIITIVLLICAFLVFIVLNVPAYIPLGNLDSLYKLLMCYNKSDSGTGESVTDGFNRRILYDSLISLSHHVVQVLLDQALWEASINLPPNHGVVGLLLANALAFCIPFALSVVCGLGFRALESSFFNAVLLNKTQKAHGLVIFAVPIHLLGKSGIWIIFTVILLLLVTSCMFSIVGASSILYHDVLATYIRPFRRQVDRETCLLCGKRRGHLASSRNICRCRSMLECEACDTDTWMKEECKNRPAATVVYGCLTHGAYRAYTDEMSKWVLLIAFTVMAGMIPLFLIFSEFKMKKFPYYGLCMPFVGCFCLSILWTRLSKAALLIGYFVSAVASLALWFALEYSSLLGSNQAELVGLGVAFFGGFLLPTLITFLFTEPLQPEVAQRVWGCVQEIDNPLVPWPELFTRQTDLRFSPRLSENKPALSEVRRALAPLRRLTWGIIVFNLVTFIGLWQIVGHSVQTLNFDRFFFYVGSVENWTYISTIFCLILPLVLLCAYHRACLAHQLHRVRAMKRYWFSRFCVARSHQK